MRIDPNETYENWAKRVQQYEYGYALQQVANGQDINVVMEAMAVRIQKKILHPILQAIKEGQVPGN
jgi:glutamyl-tRNA reductase